MKYQSLFSGKNKKNISKCCLLYFLTSMASLGATFSCKTGILLIDVLFILEHVVYYLLPVYLQTTSIYRYKLL